MQLSFGITLFFVLTHTLEGPLPPFYSPVSSLAEIIYLKLYGKLKHFTATWTSTLYPLDLNWGFGRDLLFCPEGLRICSCNQNHHLVFTIYVLRDLVCAIYHRIFFPIMDIKQFQYCKFILVYLYSFFFLGQRCIYILITNFSL